jgi:iron(III) transport system ATP-binding protein
MFLDLHQITFAYPNRPVFQDLNLSFPQRQNIAVIGESGCGKSTLLKLVYGLLDFTSGSIHFKNEPLHGPKANLVPGEKNMKMVGQEFDLMPYATVADNVGKYLSNVDLLGKKQKITALLEVVDLTDFAQQKVKFLSGGQKQRVAIAQALSQLPELLILDEAFSNLDDHIKNKIKYKIFAYAQQHQMGILMSSHHLAELVPWVDRVVVMQNGQVLGVTTPQELYQNPPNAYVAGLLGEINLWSPNLVAKHQLQGGFGMAHDVHLHPDGFLAQVIESRFAGRYYWNQLQIEADVFVMYSADKISGEVRVKFEK